MAASIFGYDPTDPTAGYHDKLGNYSDAGVRSQGQGSASGDVAGVHPATAQALGLDHPSTPVFHQFASWYQQAIAQAEGPAHLAGFTHLAMNMGQGGEPFERPGFTSLPTGGGGFIGPREQPNLTHFDATFREQPQLNQFHTFSRQDVMEIYHLAETPEEMDIVSYYDALNPFDPAHPDNMLLNVPTLFANGSPVAFQPYNPTTFEFGRMGLAPWVDQMPSVYDLGGRNQFQFPFMTDFDGSINPITGRPPPQF